jgi:hypothetical protein
MWSVAFCTVRAVGPALDVIGLQPLGLLPQCGHAGTLI